jgi:hypothetical protein
MNSTLRIIVPPTTTDMTTVGAISSELGTSSDDVFLRAPALIKQASRMIVKYVGREFAYRTVEETHHYDYNRAYHSYNSILLQGTPIRSLISVMGDMSSVDTTGLTFDAGILQGLRVYRQTVVTYTCGYKMPDETDRDLPDDLERACIDTVLALWYRPDRGDPMIKLDRADGVGITSYYDAPAHPSGLPFTAIGLLADYRAAR